MSVQIVTSEFRVNYDDHEDFLQILREEAKAAGLAEDELVDYGKEIAKQARQIKTVEDALKSERQEAARLRRELDEASDPADQNRLQRELGETETRLKALTAEAKKIGAEFDDIESPEIDLPQGGGGGFMDSITQGVGLGIGSSIIDAIPGAISAFGELNDRIRESQREVQQLTELAGDDLIEFTAHIEGTDDAFGLDFSEVLLTAYVLTKQFGISLQEALDTINDGFAVGNDAQGDYLERLKEFSFFYDEL